MNKAALSYEITLSLYEPKIPAGTTDLFIFQNGLKTIIPVGKKVIADQGYNGEPQLVSTRHVLDPRHETLNGRLKMFCVLKNFFRTSWIVMVLFSKRYVLLFSFN
jgi:hypothetical protein